MATLELECGARLLMNGMLWNVRVCVHACVFCGDLSAKEPVHVESEVVRCVVRTVGVLWGPVC